MAPAAAPNDPSSPATWENVDEASRWWIDNIIAEAGDDDEELLRKCREQTEAAEAHLERVRQVRDGAVQRLRDEGVPMTDIAKLAGVTDSALSRRILARGGKRRVDRRRKR